MSAINEKDRISRNFKGVWIPKEVWLNPELNLQEKCLLTEIDSLDNSEGCYASNQYFADFFGLTRSRISQLITGLFEKGYIDVRVLKVPGKMAIEKRVIRVTSKINSIYRKGRPEPADISGGAKEVEELQYPFDTEAFQKAWKNWLRYKKEIGKAYKSILQEQSHLKILSNYAESEAIQVIQTCIDKGYINIVPLDLSQYATNNRGQKVDFAGIGDSIREMFSDDEY